MPGLTLALGVFGASALFLTSISAAAEHVLVLETGPDAWQFLRVTGALVNDRDRVLIDPAAYGAAEETPAAHRHWKAVRLSEAPVIVANPHGGALMFRPAPDGAAIVIPDGVRFDSSAAVATATPAQLWGSTWVSYVNAAEPKRRQALATGKIFVILSAGADSVHALAGLVLKPEPFFDSGPASAGFQRRMSLLAAVVAAYPSHPAERRLAESIYQEIAVRFSTLKPGEAVPAATLAYVAVSERIWPGDERHRQLRASLTGYQQKIERSRASLHALAAIGATMAAPGGGSAGPHIQQAAAALANEDVEGAVRALMDAAGDATSPESRTARRLLGELARVSPAARDYLLRTPEPPASATLTAVAATDTAAGAEPAPEPHDTQAAAKPPKRAEPTAGKGLTIQVGAYRAARGAETVARDLTARGFEARVKQDGQIYRIMVGPFVSEKAALEARQLLARGGYYGFVRPQSAD